MNVKRSVIRQILNLKTASYRCPICGSSKSTWIKLSEYMNKEKPHILKCCLWEDHEVEVSLMENDETIKLTLKYYKKEKVIDTHVATRPVYSATSTVMPILGCFDDEYDNNDYYQEPRLLGYENYTYETEREVNEKVYIEIDLLREDCLYRNYPNLAGCFAYYEDEYSNITKYYFDPNYEKIRKLLNLIPVGYKFNSLSEFKKMPRENLNLSSRETFLFEDCGIKYNMHLYVPEDENEELEIKVYNKRKKIKINEWKISNTRPELTLDFNAKYENEEIIFAFKEDEYFQIVEKDEKAIREEKERKKMAQKLKQEREEFNRTHNILPFLIN